MRRQLVTVAMATTLTVAIAFVVPLAILVRVLAAERALDDADRIARTLIPVLVAGNDASAALAVEQIATTTSATVSVHLPDGTVLGQQIPAGGVAPAATQGRAIARTEPDGSRTRLTPVVRQRGGTSVIRVGVPAASLSAGVQGAWLTLVLVGAALVAIAVLIADRLGRTAVTQATGLAAAARRLAGGDRDARAPQPDNGGPELRDAALALNTLADRIDALLAAEREAAADLSHRLRTPMTALRLDVDALPHSTEAHRVAEDLAALDVAVDRVIRSARGAGTDGGGERVDVGRVVGDRSDFWGALATDEARPWSYVCAATAPLVVALDEERLVAVIDALLGNVLTHTEPPAGCRIVVQPVGDVVRVRIDDDGPGFTAAAAARGRSGGGSTGLGLDIVQRTIEAAGGSVRIGHPDGGGRVDLVLPLMR